MSYSESLSLTQLREQHQHALASHPTATRCLWCDWTYEGTALQGQEKAREHRRDKHAVKDKPKLVRRAHGDQLLPGDLTENVRNARLKGVGTWNT